MADEQVIEVEGVVVSVLKGTTFRVRIPNGHIVLAHISGKMRKNFIRLSVGDAVKMEMSPYDLSKGRITYRASGGGFGSRSPRTGQGGFQSNAAPSSPVN